MGHAGEDEGVHAERDEFVEPGGDLVVVADQAEERAGAQPVEAAPHVRLDLQIAVRVTGARGELPAATPADRLAGLGGPLGLAETLPAAFDLLPRLFLGLPGQHVHPYGELRGSVTVAAYEVELLGER